jgi:hypothetical protein
MMYAREGNGGIFAEAPKMSPNPETKVSLSMQLPRPRSRLSRCDSCKHLRRCGLLALRNAASRSHLRR